MFEPISNSFIFNDKSSKTQKNIFNKNFCNGVVSPTLITSPFNIPGCPEYLSAERINKINNIHILKKLEHEYDDFLEKKGQILLLLNNIDEVFYIREEIILRINYLRRHERNLLLSLVNSKK